MTGPSQHEGFTGVGRSIVDEDEITLTSVGVDIGSSPSHLVFSRLGLERQKTRYVIVKRTVLRESEILLTPYLDEGATIDSDALGRFIARQYKAAGLEREEVDTGALIALQLLGQLIQCIRTAQYCDTTAGQDSFLDGCTTGV